MSEQNDRIRESNKKYWPDPIDETIIIDGKEQLVEMIFTKRDWVQYFMSIAYLVSTKSKDQSTHLGAVFVADDNTILSTGYNSFPRGLNDDVPARQIRPEKYYWMAHAERNGIYNAARKGITLEGSTLYTPAMPCHDCAIAVIQAGVKRIYLDYNWGISEGWGESQTKAREMLHEVGVEIYYFNGDLRDVHRYKRGKVF